MKTFRLLSVFFFIPFLLVGCKHDPPIGPEEVKPPTTHIEFVVPEAFPQVSIPLNNQLTVEGVSLGRRLYYDKLLSKNGPLNGSSCSSCHDQTISFTLNSPGTAVIPHVNMAWRTNFLWNGKIEGTLEDIMMFEVAEFFQADVGLLQNDPVYPGMYKAAFGTSEITRELTAKAMAQFFRRFVSSNSKYDKYLRRETALSFSERNGLNIFQSEKGDCFHCHSLPLSRDNSFHNIGLDSAFDSDNFGRFHITSDSGDIGKFMTPTLRNIELTHPYMHDGRFANLREVIEHYNTGVRQSDYLDPIMTKNRTEDGLGLTNGEINDLISFLKTLTDTSYCRNPNLSSPF
jgi:cytochrome c peroxidase